MILFDRLFFLALLDRSLFLCGGSQRLGLSLLSDDLKLLLGCLDLLLVEVYLFVSILLQVSESLLEIGEFLGGDHLVVTLVDPLGLRVSFLGPLVGVLFVHAASNVD